MTTQTMNDLPPPRNQLPRGKRPTIGGITTSVITVRFKRHKALLDRLKAYALAQDRTLNQIIIDLLDKNIPE